MQHCSNGHSGFWMHSYLTRGNEFADMITVTLKGADIGNMVDFEGVALQLPGVNFKATLTRISD